MRYIVDTSIINKLVNGSIGVDELPGDGEFAATHIQIDEINKTKDTERRARLFLMFSKMIDDIVPTESIVFGTTRFDEGKFGDGETFLKTKNLLDSKNLNKNGKSNINDALITEVAKKNNYTLITADYHMYETAKALSVECLFWETSRSGNN